MALELLDEETQALVDKVQKLLRLAAKNPNPHEREAAEAKAHEWLAKFNLDMATVEQHGDIESGKRAEENLKGGYYQFQRDLWKAVAELNFCLYWNQMARIVERKFLPNPKLNGFRRHEVERYENQHRLVGRIHNIILTRTMAEYIEQAIEHAIRDACKGSGEQTRSKWANDLRSGAAERVVERIYQKRREMIREQERAARDAEIKAREAGREGVSTGRAVTLATLADIERDANHDFLVGEDGYSARVRKEEAEARTRRAEIRRQAEQEWAEWCAANPEEAARRAKEERARERRNAARRERYWHEQGQYNSRRSYGGTSRRDRSAYYAGRDIGDTIGIDPQAAQRGSAGRLG